MTPQIRKPGAVRREELLDAAIPLAERYGYESVSRAMVGEECGVSETLVSYYWRPVAAWHDAIMARAIETGNLTVVGQGLAARHPLALDAPEPLRIEAARALV